MIKVIAALVMLFSLEANAQSLGIRTAPDYVKDTSQGYMLIVKYVDGKPTVFKVPSDFVLRNAKGTGDTLLWFKSASEVVVKTIVQTAGINNDSTLYIGSGGSTTADSLRRVGSSRPSTGNIWLDTVANRIKYISGGYIYKVSITDSIAVSPYGDELVTNGAFGADASWGKSNSTTITGGQGVFNTATNFGPLLDQNIPAFVNTRTYKFEFDISSYTSGSIAIGIGDFSNGVYSSPATTIASNGHYNFNLFLNDPIAPLSLLIFSLGSGAVMHIDNITVKEVY